MESISTNENKSDDIDIHPNDSIGSNNFISLTQEEIEDARQKAVEMEAKKRAESPTQPSSVSSSHNDGSKSKRSKRNKEENNENRPGAVAVPGINSSSTSSNNSHDNKRQHQRSLERKNRQVKSRHVTSLYSLRESLPSAFEDDSVDNLSLSSEFSGENEIETTIINVGLPTTNNINDHSIFSADINSFTDDGNGTLFDEEQPQPLYLQEQNHEQEIAVAAVVVKDEQELIHEAQERTRQEMITNAAQAQVVAETAPKHRKLLYCCICILVLMAIIVAIVALIIIPANKDENPFMPVDRFEIETSSPSISLIPSNVPTLLPTQIPSNIPSTFPSSKPSIFPSSPPSPAPTSPDNGQCENAIELDQHGNNMVQGDLYFSNSIETFVSCIPSHDMFMLYAALYGPSRWYSFVGTGSSFAIRLCTDYESTIVTIFSDSCSEGAFCLEYPGLKKFTNLRNGSVPQCRLETLLILDNSKTFATYRIGIALMEPISRAPSNNETNSIESDNDGPAEGGQQISGSSSPAQQSNGLYTLELTKSNYFCEGAEMFDFTRSVATFVLGLEITGSTMGAPIFERPGCIFVTNSLEPGVWYKFEGKNELLELSACSLSSDVVNQISIFYRDESSSEELCNDQLVCVASIDDSCETPVKFVAELGKIYYVLVISRAPEGTNFVLTAPQPQPV